MKWQLNNPKEGLQRILNYRTVTNNAIELLDESMRRRKQLLAAMDQVEVWRVMDRKTGTALTEQVLP